MDRRANELDAPVDGRATNSAGVSTSEADAGPPSFYQRYLAPNQIPRIGVGPLLRFDSALAASGGIALLLRLGDGCTDFCGNHFAYTSGELGLFGQQARLGYAFEVVAPTLVRYLLLNGLGLSASVAYLRRTKTFDGTLSSPEQYAGFTLAVTVLATVQVGVYGDLAGHGNLISASVGFGY